MTSKELLQLFKTAGKRAIQIGNEQNGIIIGLDQEGRLFYTYNGQVVSRVAIASIQGISDRSGYKNPGGDGIWPAPEGTCFGYEYPTGDWEVPIGLINARFIVLERQENHAVIEAEIPLINAQQLGLTTLFRRDIQLNTSGNKMIVRIEESIEYTGKRTLTSKEFLLAPWSLCQFDWVDGDLFSFPGNHDTKIRDLYTASNAYQKFSNGSYTYAPTEDKRYQIALGEDIEAIHLLLKSKNVKITRTLDTANMPGGFIDIADSPTDEKPLSEGIKFSFYSDPSRFVEIEAAGYGIDTLRQGDILKATTTTIFEQA